MNALKTFVEVALLGILLAIGVEFMLLIYNVVMFCLTSIIISTSFGVSFYLLGSDIWHYCLKKPGTLLHTI